MGILGGSRGRQEWLSKSAQPNPTPSFHLSNLRHAAKCLIISIANGEIEKSFLKKQAKDAGNEAP